MELVTSERDTARYLTFTDITYVGIIRFDSDVRIAPV